MRSLGCPVSWSDLFPGGVLGSGELYCGRFLMMGCRALVVAAACWSGGRLSLSLAGFDGVMAFPSG